MGGIAGIISNGIHESVLKKMSRAISHRGPAGEGLWINPTGTAGLASRLSVREASTANDQPMSYRNRYSLVFDGRIYNHAGLRQELRKSGYEFRTSGDTEVMLAAYDCYKQNCLRYFEGMFSFAIWDENTKTLFAARDRFGEKPFYFWNEGPHFVFASEMKALWAAGIERTCDHRMMLNYLALGQVQNATDKSQTFFENILSLPPGHYLIFDAVSGKAEISSYWSLDKHFQQEITDRDALEMADHLLNSAVQGRLNAAGPAGGILSEDIASSALTWYALQQRKDYRTFSTSPYGDASGRIRAVNEQIPHENHLLALPDHEGISDFEKLAWHQEEPFPCSGTFAQFRLFEHAAGKGMKAMLGTHGADEILGGHPRYVRWYLQDLIGNKKWGRAAHEFRRLRRHEIPFQWNIGNVLASFLPSHASINLEKKDYERIVSHPELTRDYIKLLRGREWEGISRPYVRQLNDTLYFDIMQMGLEERLRYADRSAMAHSIELHLPYLKTDLVRFIFSLPASFKIRDGHLKWILRKIMEARIPASEAWHQGNEDTTVQTSRPDSLLPRDLMQESVRFLVSEKILKPSVLQRGRHSKGSQEPLRRCDWKYLCAAALMKKKPHSH